MFVNKETTYLLTYVTAET